MGIWRPDSYRGCGSIRCLANDKVNAAAKPPELHVSQQMNIGVC